MDVELLCHKLSLSVSLFDTSNLDLNEEEVDNMPEDQTASADTLMVLLTLLCQAEIFFPGERVYYSLLRLKLFPQEQPEQPTLSVKRGAPNPYSGMTVARTTLEQTLTALISHFNFFWSR